MVATTRNTRLPETGFAPEPAGVPARRPAVPEQRRGRPAPRTTAVRSAELAHLDMRALRTYRDALNEEERKVSYWRRIMQARLDIVVAGVDADRGRASSRLGEVLADEKVQRGRQVLLSLAPPDPMEQDIPHLPQLQALWNRPWDPADGAANDQLVTELRSAERALSDYRNAVHRRIATATDEMIARYKEDPSGCLSVLPLTAPVRPRTKGRT